MPQTFVVDQRLTFQAVAFLNCQAKLVFGSRDRQETNNEGINKWEIELVAGFYQFGKVTSEVIKVGITSPTNPCEGFPMYSPVQMNNFVVGVNPPKEIVNDKGEKRISGGTAWYRCDEIRAAAPATASTSK